MLTSEFDMSAQNFFCTDIEHDHTYFYMRYKNIGAKDDDPESEKEQIRRVAHKWRSRIKYNYTVPVKHEDWQALAQSKLHGYLKLYIQFVNVAIYYLVAHRNYISTFDMSAKNGRGSWKSHKFICKTNHIRDIVV